MLTFLKFALLAFVGQLGLLAAGIYFQWLLEVILMAWLWPLLLIPSAGSSHGGELVFAPITIIGYSILFGFVAVIWKRYW